MPSSLNRILYLGLKPPVARAGSHIIHYPIIRIEGLPPSNADIALAMQDFDQYTHIVLTSQSALPLLFSAAACHGITKESFANIPAIVVGKSTAEAAKRYGLTPLQPPEEESAEGIVKLMSLLHFYKPYLLWPHSSLSRTLLSDYFIEQGIRYQSCVLYDTVPNFPLPKPDLDSIDEIVFTSPSTINAFLQLFDSIPSNIKITCIGPITEKHIQDISISHKNFP
jgi:uroporphyrinogen-III synthase